jgi:hypothetical protein
MLTPQKIPIRSGSVKRVSSIQGIGGSIALNVTYCQYGTTSSNPGDEVYSYIGNECWEIAEKIPGMEGKLF